MTSTITEEMTGTPQLAVMVRRVARRVVRPVETSRTLALMKFLPVMWITQEARYAVRRCVGSAHRSVECA